MQIVAKTNVQLSRFCLLFDNTPVGVGPQTKINRIETALNTPVQSTRPLNPILTMINIRREAGALLRTTQFLVEALGWKPILDGEECPIIAENGAITGLVAYFGLGGVEV